MIADDEIAAARAAALARAPDAAAGAGRLSALLAAAPVGRYSAFSPETRAFWHEHRTHPRLAEMHGLVLVDAIAASRPASAGRSALAAAESRRWRARVLDAVRVGDLAPYAAPGQTLFKDLAACRGTATPAGAWLLDRARFSRRYVVAGPLTGLPSRALFHLLEAAGRDWLSGAYHPLEAGTFNADGFIVMARLAAERCADDPALGGLFSGPNWLNDPRLPAVSPHFAYRREIALGGGARAFFSHWEGDDSWALRRSASRRAAYAQGRYHPAAHLIVWPRRRLLAWAERAR